MSSALNPLLARRSVVKYLDKPVGRDIVDRALASAIMAPNHFLSEPWRFYIAGPETKEKLATMTPEKESMFRRVPNWCVVTMKSEHALDAKLGLEDHAAVSCAMQNFMLQLTIDGVSSKWLTGALGTDPAVIKKIVGAGEDEHFMGAIWYGYGEKDPKAPQRKKGVEGIVSNLP